ncbi:MAG: hypothetical protein HYW27_04435 [Candidatus Aenigmarchaeota archaeon]|nr:hypothetical protein [Candidatus Aenigmarchaeota archaeon]
MKISYILVIAVILIAGCVQEEAPVNEVSIPGHAEVYTFSNDIRDAIKVNATEPAEMRKMFYKGQMNVVFDGSSQQDNAYFTVVMSNIMAKVPTYLAYEGVFIKFQPYYFIGDTWYDKNGNEIEKPDFGGPVLWLKGPATGAEETSVKLENATIILQGTSYKELTLAADKLALVAMKVDRI